MLLSFSLLGLVTGLLAGFSREAAMGAVLPAVLSLVGALAIYLVGVEKADQALVGVCVIALSLDLLVGSIWGAVLRDEYEREQGLFAFKVSAMAAAAPHAHECGQAQGRWYPAVAGAAV